MKSFVLFALGAAALTTTTVSGKRVALSLGGKPLSLESVVVNGKTYVSLDQLKAQFTPQGGSAQMTAGEGSVGEWLFNGVWRFQVTKVEWNAQDGFWNVSITIKNGSKTTRRPADNGLTGTPSNQFHLATEGGNTLGIPLGSLANGLQVEIGYKDLAPGMGTTAVLHFPGGKADDKPVKLIAEFVNVPKIGFVKDPSFRVDLTKTAS